MAMAPLGCSRLTRRSHKHFENASPATGLRLAPGPGVLEAERAVEDAPLRRRVGVRAEVAETLELHGLADRQGRENRLDETLPEHRLRVGVEVGEEVALSTGI